MYSGAAGSGDRSVFSICLGVIITCYQEQHRSDSMHMYSVPHFSSEIREHTFAKLSFDYHTSAYVKINALSKKKIFLNTKFSSGLIFCFECILADGHANKEATSFFLINLLHIIYTRCTKISYKTVPATNFTT